MGILYYKLEAFIPNAKDVWDFCLGGLKELDDALDKVVSKKEPESFLKPIISEIEEYQKNIRQIQVQFTDAPQFNETKDYPHFLS